MMLSFRVSGGGIAVIDENNLPFISSLLVTTAAVPARPAVVDDKGKTVTPAVAAKPEIGYYKSPCAEHLWTYVRDAVTGAIKTKWSRITYPPIESPVLPVLSERRGVLRWDYSRKMWVFDDITEHLTAYLAELEAKKLAELEAKRLTLAVQGNSKLAQLAAASSNILVVRPALQVAAVPVVADSDTDEIDSEVDEKT